MITENGWPDCGPNDLDRKPIPGTDVVIPLQKGQPSLILKAFAADLNWYVESVYNSRGGTDEGGWTGTNSVPTSNHLGGTAFDYNWSDHPLGYAAPDPRAGWNGSTIIKGDQTPYVRELLDYYEGMVYWGNDWRSPKDSMHFQMGYNTYGPVGSTTWKRVEDFIARKIDITTGFSRFREHKGTTGVNFTALLSEAMLDVSGVDYAYYVPLVARTLRDCECTTEARIAMWCTQVGHESLSLKYMEEIADGSQYEGRTDLGNTQPGDGKRFKGRGPIQVTGRYNYTKFSEWAHSKGIVSTPDYFVMNPSELSKPEYGFHAVTWYWTVQRPMNQAADARNLEQATKYINGGLNGLPDRKMRYERTTAMGSRLLNLLLGEDDWMSDPTIVKMIKEIHGCLFNQIGSQSRYRADGEGDIWKLHELIKNDDGMVHEAHIERLAVLGDPSSIALVARNSERGDKLAQAVLIRIEDKYLTETQQHLKNTIIAQRFPEG